MDVTALLPPPLLSHLRVVLSHGHHLVAARNWKALTDAVRRAPVDVVVLDPLGEGGIGINDVLALRAAHRRLPIVVYTALQPAAMQATVELARCGVNDVVLHRFDDEPRRFLELLERLPGYSLADRMLELLEPSLGRARGPLVHALERLFRTPSRFRGVPDLAAAAGMTIRMVYRRFDELALTSPAQVVQAARLLRAFAYLRDDQLLVVDVAQKLGYSSHRILAQQMQEAIGLTPTEARNTLAPEEFIALLHAWLLRPEERAAPIVADAGPDASTEPGA